MTRYFIIGNGSRQIVYLYSNLNYCVILIQDFHDEDIDSLELTENMEKSVVTAPEDDCTVQTADIAPVDDKDGQEDPDVDLGLAGTDLFKVNRICLSLL